MARKKKTKKGGLLSFFSKKKKGRKGKNQASFASGWKISLTILFLAIVLGGGAVGLIYMDRHVKVVAKETTAEVPVVFTDPPIWMNPEVWKDWTVGVLGGSTFSLDQHTAQTIAGKLQTVAWFKRFKVQTQSDRITVGAEYRTPVGLVRLKNGDQVYVADDMVILNYLPISANADTTIPIVEIKGASTTPPEPGQVWLAEDAKAAVEILKLLCLADQQYLKEERIKKPLLSEIASVDVSNFAERKSRSLPSIVLVANDGTSIYWGAAIGQATVSVEAPEKTKLLRLYQHFMDYNTLQGTAKTIDLTWLEDEVPRPRY